jgi:hypothetical protein
MKTTTVELELTAAEIECDDFLISAGRYVGSATRMREAEGAAAMYVMLEVGPDGYALRRFDLTHPVRVLREVRA